MSIVGAGLAQNWDAPYLCRAPVPWRLRRYMDITPLEAMDSNPQ